MPGVAHIAVSLLLSLFLNKFTKGKFGIKHSIIFTVNSLVGPDLAGIFFDYDSPGYFFIHGYGWFAFALPLTFIWMLFTEFSLTWKPFKISKRDSRKEFVINKAEVFSLIAAGGIFHQFVDLIGHPSTIIYEGSETPWGAIWFGNWGGEDIWFSIEAIWGTGMFPCGNELGFWEFYLFLPLVLAPAILLMFFYMQKNSKAFYISSLVIVTIITVPLVIAFYIPDASGFDVFAPEVNYFGDPSYIPSVYRLTGGEADLGAIVFCLLLLFVPLMFLYFGYNGFPKIKLSEYRQQIKQIEDEEHARALQRIAELNPRSPA